MAGAGAPTQPGSAELERQADELLGQLPVDQRAGILLPYQLRDRKRREIEAAQVRAEAPGADPAAIERQWERVSRFMDRARLSANERAVVYLYYYADGGMTDQQIAVVLGCRRETVTLRRHKALEALKGVLGAEGIEAPFS